MLIKNIVWVAILSNIDSDTLDDFSVASFCLIGYNIDKDTDSKACIIVNITHVIVTA